MSEGLNATLVMPDVGEKPSVPYRTSPYTVRQYCALPYAQRRAVGAACNAPAGRHYRTETDPKTDKTFTVGRRTAEPTLHLPAPSLTMFLSECPPAALRFQAASDVEDTAPVQPTFEPNPALKSEGEPTDPACAYPDQGPAFFAALTQSMIQKSNLLHLKPLGVTPELGIIDGQHRWAAARELGLLIFYKVGEQLSEADITTLSTASKNWTGTDWLKYYAVKRKHAYVALADFMQRHLRISFSNAKIMLSGQGGGRKADEFRAGRWDGAEDADMPLAE